MIDPFDYKEPACALCDGKDFYYPDPEKPKGSIPVQHVIAKLDAAEGKNDFAEAARLLEYWESEGLALGDKRGLVTIYSEQMGLYRKLNEKEKGLRAVERGLALVKDLDLTETVSGATILLNAATTLKAFGKAEESIPLYETVEKVYDEHLEANDVKKAGLYNNSALAYADLRDYTTAEANYEKALRILESNAGTENEIAITYVNMAHLFEHVEDGAERIYTYMENALAALDSPNVVRNGYHAFVCSKCAPSFGYFGYFLAEEKLNNRAKEIYEGA